MIESFRMGYVVDGLDGNMMMIVRVMWCFVVIMGALLLYVCDVICAHLEVAMENSCSS